MYIFSPPLPAERPNYNITITRGVFHPCGNAVRGWIPAAPMKGLQMGAGK